MANRRLRISDLKHCLGPEIVVKSAGNNRSRVVMVEFEIVDIAAETREIGHSRAEVKPLTAVMIWIMVVSSGSRIAITLSPCACASGPVRSTNPQQDDLSRYTLGIQVSFHRISRAES